MKDSTFIKLQKMVPQAKLSRWVGKFANSNWTPLKNTLITWFIDRYGVNMEEAIESNPYAYDTFNDFFTRELKPGLRPLPTDPTAIACPCDCAVSQSGTIYKSQIIQAKDHFYTVENLIGDYESSKPYMEGQFATLYLAPKDYHRIHLPIAAKLTKMRYIAGKLFSVNKVTANHIPDLFANNERLVMYFESEQGPYIIVLVGAMIVASIVTPFAGLMAPQESAVQEWHYEHNPISLKQGEEIGHFQLGSTAILLLPKGAYQLDTLAEGQVLKMGEVIGKQRS